ncbi:phospholipase D-like domain-containing protein [Methylocella silvestris]|uniref:phospholipase D n=1 Tax=Methylocella silvestris TaxID=199596 RepID=A0A2J7TK35_METSI|nr:phospholipase D-like domain-containing protein [Methylocella silvestris]PNG27123.1 phosphatidylserine synthase [Methylocella silvestris]
MRVSQGQFRAGIFSGEERPAVGHRRSFASAALAGLVLVAIAAAAPESSPIPRSATSIHYAPAENLERIDVSLIDQAEREIDMAAYVLTDWPVMQALSRAARRGVKIRIYLDYGRIGQRDPSAPFMDLLDNPDIEIGLKRAGAPLMHLKSYQIDGAILRTGAANFSASGLKKQDNDLIIVDDPAAAADFKRRFEEIFAASEPLPSEAHDRRMKFFEAGAG